MKAVTTPSLPVTRKTRVALALPDERFDKRGRLKISSQREARDLAVRIGNYQGGLPPSAADIYGAAWIHTAWRLMLDNFGEGRDPFEPGALEQLSESMGEESRDALLVNLATAYADDAVWHGRRTPGESALREAQSREGKRRLSGRERTLRNWTLSRLAAEDPAFAPFSILFRDDGLDTRDAGISLDDSDTRRPGREPEEAPPLATLRKPVEAAPDSVKDQLLYILTRWGSVLGNWTTGMVGALDMIEEETRPRFSGGGPGPVQRPGLTDMDDEANFSHDHDWMPQVVMIAKNVLVWLDQLSKTYRRNIRTLNQIPDEELDVLASRGFNALWLIGLWERSTASREIKQRMGNPEAAASAYSLFGYDIDPELGGWEALENLRSRAGLRGIRMSSDMVPNHVGIDSDWVRQHPDRLLAVEECPYPTYGWESENLSGYPGVDIRLEDHYWDKTDAAVVFRRVDNDTGATKYIYHGNDGTTMPWNDTAQIDFLNAEAREAVIRDILHVARNFPVIRFDAAMVLARKSIRRLWYPAPGAGGAIPSRSEHALSDEAFEAATGGEFWREVVDRVAQEVPGTLLLAEAFWMMEGYFVRSLGMHRVYNSAFMNMLRDEKNDEYRAMMKETLAFDPGILQRYVNFMNNPDEETAVDQFGKGDRYFATATLLATLPGLPMFGHGQVEGLSEKYGMEYVRAYKEEQPDTDLIARHERELFPLIHRRGLFAGADTFRLYDLSFNGGVNENVYAYTNSDHQGPSLVIVNNTIEQARGQLHYAAAVKSGEKVLNSTLAEALIPSHLGNEDWVLLREMLSNLWFIRSAEEIRTRGLSIDINGFGRQLYLDYRYEKETTDSIWGRLATELSGGGTPDPDDAIAEIRLRPIRSALDTLVSPDWLEEAAASLSRGRVPEWKDRTAEVADLIAAHQRLFPETEEEWILNSSGLNRIIRNRLKRAAGYRRFFSCRSCLRRILNRDFPEEAGGDETFLALWSVIGTLAGEVSAESFRETSLKWGLQRWLLNNNISDTCSDAAVRLESAGAAISLLEKSSLKSREPGEVLSNLMSDPVFRFNCAVNAWEGVLWFGRDEWNRSVRAATLAAGCDSRFRLRRIIRVWSHAAAVSGYRLNELLKAAR